MTPGRCDPDEQGGRVVGEILGRHDARLQQRALVIGWIYGVDPREVFDRTRGEVWSRRDDLVVATEPDVLTELWLLLARHARQLASPTTPPVPVDSSAVDRIAPVWRAVYARAVLADAETLPFRAMVHLPGALRDVLVLGSWLRIDIADIADELRSDRRTVAVTLDEARAAMRTLLVAARGPR